MAQHMIHQDDGYHGFRDGGGADADAGIMAACGNDFHRLTPEVNAMPGQTEAGSWLQGNASEDILPGGNPSQNTASVVT
jgi:hypothetical protein